MNSSQSRLRCTLAFVLLLSMASGCEAQDVMIPITPSDPPDGMWLSDGYGYFYEYQNNEVIDFYDVTPELCRTATPKELELENDGLSRAVFRTNEAQDTMFLSTLSSPHEIKFRKVSGIPEQCNVSVPNTPIGNFDALVSYFEAHYPFFDVHGINWSSATKQVRAKISTATSDQELFDVFEDLLRPIKDLHVSLEGDVDGKTRSFRAGRGQFEEDIEAYASREGISRHKAILRHQKGYWKKDVKEILGRRPKTVGRDGIKFGITPNNVGYIAIMAEGNYVRGDNLEKDVAAAHKIMSDILSTFTDNNVKAVIVDLSANMGGYDAVSLAIAGHFTDTEYLAYTKEAGDAVDPVVTPLNVYPAQGPRFTGPVYVLTADLTRSAGETLTLALRALPNVTHAGQPTRGSLSDEFYKALPNGWYLSMSNEIYKDLDGQVWEGIGIEPEWPLTVFRSDDPTQGHVEAVRSILKRVDR